MIVFDYVGVNASDHIGNSIKFAVFDCCLLQIYLGVDHLSCSELALIRLPSANLS